MRVILLISLFMYSYAWWCNGHMITAMIAQLDLAKNSPEVLQTANQVLAPLNGALSHGLDNTFVETACWADDIRYFGVDSMTLWHYIDRPYNLDGLLNATRSSINVLWGINQTISTLKNDNHLNAPLETSMMIRFLIHFVGDMHQPLHNTELISKLFPNGDAGGNLFPIVYNSQINQLHKLWDWALGVSGDDCPRPLSKQGWGTITKISQEIMDELPRKDLAEFLSDPYIDNWSVNNFHIAVNAVYEGIEMNGRPNEGYLLRGRKIAKKQLALGGYRLADILRSLYEDTIAL